ncbi:hypothetical protein M9H77_13263 [Catharanthus roseus]|uniref:Uncharacterized protein n=1 Tax=Catharanthus roseus TaxID=4058 RepID=A0ACC0BJU4_CATRO|nr:hypothetical protein M9H77_13263 [Catharanthus roseus]
MLNYLLIEILSERNQIEMALRFQSFHLAILVISLISLEFIWAIPGGWEPIKDPSKRQEVVDIGKFAIEEHNKKAKTELKFQDVIKGEFQVVEGFNYRLIISASSTSNLDIAHKYQAIVWVNDPLSKDRTLVSFKNLN